MKPMKISEVLRRLSEMASRADSTQNARALSLAREMIDNAATVSMIPPPQQQINIDLSKVEGRIFDYIAKNVGSERARTFIPGAVQPEDLNPIPESEEERKARYRVSGTATGRTVPATNKNGVSQTPSDWIAVYDGPQVFVIGDKFKLAFPSRYGPSLLGLVRHHNDEMRGAKAYAIVLEAANKELALRNNNQSDTIELLRGSPVR